MKKSTIIFMLILVLLVGCKTVEPTMETNEPITEPTSQKMPAPGFEDVPEMIVNQENMPPVDDLEEPIAPAEIIEINVKMRQFEFDPNPIIVPKGSHVFLTLTTEDVEHGFAINEYNINEKVSPGETKLIDFIADKAGEFEIRCSVVCGSGHGSMRGKFIVQ